MGREHPLVMREWQARGEQPEVLLWVGCAASFDDRAQKIVKAFATILTRAGVTFGILGEEEVCTGDPARRAGNELLFQMLAKQNIETLRKYGVRKIVTICPHCYNSFKHDYPQLGLEVEVWHSTQFIAYLIDTGRLTLAGNKGESVTFHDPCYLARMNGIEREPRSVLEALGVHLREMRRHGRNSFCCGAGGAQMFKEEEAGREKVYRERAKEALHTGAKTLVTACPFCMIMMRDGVRELSNDQTEVKDIVELVAEALPE